MKWLDVLFLLSTGIPIISTVFLLVVFCRTLGQNGIMYPFAIGSVIGFMIYSVHREFKEWRGVKKLEREVEELQEIADLLLDLTKKNKD